jgi:peptidase M50B-like protein
MQTQAEIKDSFKLLMLATIVTVVLWFIPYASVVTYPVRLFGTFIHETGHALAALITFGSVKGITMDWNGNGLTLATTGSLTLYLSAGYLSTTLYGAGLLIFLRRARNARIAALVTGVLLLGMTVLYGGNSVVWVTGIGFGAGCLLLGWKGNLRFVHFFMSFLAIQSLLNAVYDLRTLLYLSAFGPDVFTDAQSMAKLTGGWIPAIVWAFGWMMISFILLGVTLFYYYKSLQQRAAVANAIDFPLLARRRSAADN